MDEDLRKAAWISVLECQFSAECRSPVPAWKAMLVRSGLSGSGWAQFRIKKLDVVAVARWRLHLAAHGCALQGGNLMAAHRLDIGTFVQ